MKRVKDAGPETEWIARRNTQNLEDVFTENSNRETTSV